MYPALGVSSAYALGLTFLVLVSLIWTAASIVIQHLYQDLRFDSPFLLTYVGTSLFVIFLPVRLAWERRRRFVRWASSSIGFGRKGVVDSSSYARVGQGDEESDVGGCDKEEEEEVIIPWRLQQPQVSDGIAGLSAARAIEMGPPRPYQHPPPEGQAPLTPSAAEENGDGANHRDGSCDNEVESKDGRSSGSPRDASDDMQPGRPPPSSRRRQRRCRSSDHLLSHVDHLRIASRIAPFWFVSNYFYNLSLEYTSITSSTVLASTGSLFTFVFATACGDESFTACKLCGVLLCFSGSVLTGWGDAEQASAAASGEDSGPSSGGMGVRMRQLAGVGGGDVDGDGDESPVWGDVAGLLSAVGYGTYTVLIRNLCPHDESRMSMQLVFGYIGALNMVGLLPVAVRMIAAPPSHRAVFTWEVFLYLAGMGMLNNVLSDYLWARAVVLTSATVASVGLGLTIPLAFLADWVTGRTSAASAESVLGALFVLFGFVFVNLGDSHVEEEADGVRSDADVDADEEGPVTSDKLSSSGASG